MDGRDLLDDVRGNIKKMKINNWKKVVKDREEWMKIVELAKTHLELCILES